MPERSTRIPALDGLRGVASLQVFAYHHFVRVLPPDAADPFGLVSLVQRCSNQLFSGVDLFFVLSGFLITRILLDARGSAHYFTAFYVRRTCRILPLYFVVLTAFLLADAAGGSSRWPELFESSLATWPYVFFLQNFWMAAANSFGALWLAGTWSLAVEEQFYLLLPVAVRRLSMRALAIVVVACIVVAPLVRLAIQATDVVPSLGSYVLILARGDSLAWGSMLALIRYVRPEVLKAHSRWFWPTIVVVGGAALFIGARPWPSFERLAAMDRSLLALFYALILALVLERPAGRLAASLSRPWPRAFGDMAYANYLLHPIVLGIVVVELTGHAPVLRTWSDAAAIAAAALVSIALSAASWRYLERPIVRFGQAYRY